MADGGERQEGWEGGDREGEGGRAGERGDEKKNTRQLNHPTLANLASTGQVRVCMAVGGGAVVASADWKRKVNSSR